MPHDHDNLDYCDLARQDKAERIYLSKLASHPDCRDPDHPGCAACCENEDEQEDEACAA